MNLADVQLEDFVAVFLTESQEFLAVLFAPGRDVLQGPVIIRNNLQDLPLMQILQVLSRFQKMHGADPIYQVRSGIGLAVFQESHNLLQYYILFIYIISLILEMSSSSIKKFGGTR
jgi:hypothetical protein